MSEKRPVIVKVRGSWQDAEGQKDSIRTVAKGHHYFHRGKHYVIYEDESVEQGKKISTVLKIDDGHMTLLRRGVLEQEQRFETGREHTSIYRTPYGNIDLAVRTEELQVDYGEIAGRVDIRYGLLVNGAFQSQNQLHIEVEEDMPEA
ncbi:DUF1934 domain-containing protein [uncultured Mitsuokella sp.]|uniref:DUF1934 domain-containing protein n=1 Tax=uncultured Mitsuokella sp. TaxID=453120 RepID=UPI00266F106D|nr:DUF1934 domain-containing protein [uncultured Mitsuokella sp.]